MFVPLPLGLGAQVHSDPLLQQSLDDRHRLLTYPHAKTADDPINAIPSNVQHITFLINMISSLTEDLRWMLDMTYKTIIPHIIPNAVRDLRHWYDVTRVATSHDSSTYKPSTAYIKQIMNSRHH